MVDDDYVCCFGSPAGGQNVKATYFNYNSRTVGQGVKIVGEGLTVHDCAKISHGDVTMQVSLVALMCTRQGEARMNIGWQKSTHMLGFLTLTGV
jgi:hypothetical protein